MRLRLLLPRLVLFFLAPSVLLAQYSAASEHFRIAGVFQLPVLTQDQFNHLFSQAVMGDREAQYWLALLYRDGGKFVPKDSVKSVDWLNKSAEQGYAPAQRVLDGFTMNLSGTNRDPVGNEMYLLRGAEQGNADSQFWLGVAYEQNWFGTTDVKEAAKWYRKAAEQGQPDAQTSLGMLYEDGEGVEQDYAVAAEWYRKAAEHVPDLGGAGVGRSRLASLYTEGRGVPKDYVQAYMWFSVSSSEHNPNHNLTYVESLMTPEEILAAKHLAERWEKEHPSP
jgi:TPR repeat protein